MKYETVLYLFPLIFNNFFWLFFQNYQKPNETMTENWWLFWMPDMEDMTLVIGNRVLEKIS